MASEWQLDQNIDSRTYESIKQNRDYVLQHMELFQIPLYCTPWEIMFHIYEVLKAQNQESQDKIKIQNPTKLYQNSKTTEIGRSLLAQLDQLKAQQAIIESRLKNLRYAVTDLDSYRDWHRFNEMNERIVARVSLDLPYDDAPLLPPVQRILTKEKEKKEKEEVLKQMITSCEKRCLICRDNNKEIVFIPCGHFACCRACSDNCSTCPTCCATIKPEQKVKVLFV
jgi:hypothetical protein